MGEIAVSAKLENAGDRVAFEQGYHDESSIRSTAVTGIVDTGAVTLVLPQNVVERLDLKTRRTVVVTYADDRKEERPVAGPLTIEVCDRFMSTDCIVGPPLSEPLIGQVVLESLDLIADCAQTDSAAQNAGLSVVESEVNGACSSSSGTPRRRPAMRGSTAFRSRMRRRCLPTTCYCPCWTTNMAAAKSGGFRKAERTTGNCWSSCILGESWKIAPWSVSSLHGVQRLGNDDATN